MGRAYSARQKRIKVRVEGGAEIAKSLRAMEDAASQILMDAAKKGGKIALDDAKKNCPVDTGTLRDSLKLSEHKASNVRADVKVEYDKKLKYGIFVELGSKGRKAKPFLRNAVDNNQDRINKAIVNEIADAVGRKM